ncbi:MAG: fibronectin type III domain-containing protein [Planctomycetes bacterium]|nr:fibronectin type III domain-containing protein [Planctomycetota bacterium]
MRSTLMNRGAILAVLLLASGCGFATITVIGVSGGGGGGVAAPAKASGVAAMAASPTSVAMSWTDNADNETGFVIEVRVGNAGEFSEAVRLGNDAVAHVVQGLVPETTYDLRVVALNSGGRAASNVVTATTPAAMDIAAVVPDSATTDVADPIRLVGRGFRELRPGAALSILFAGTPAMPATVVDDRMIAVTPPHGVAGDATITLDNGYERLDRTAAFTYFRPAPTFPPNDSHVNLNRLGQSGALDVELCCSGRVVYAAWRDQPGVGRHGSDIYFSRSLDGAVVWQDEARLDRGAQNAGDSQALEMACAGDAVYVVWQDTLPDPFTDRFWPDIHLNRSLDRGLTWLEGGAVRLDPGVEGAAVSVAPQIAASATNVYVVWTEHYAGREQIYFDRSRDRGTTWLSEAIRISDDESPSSTGPVIRCDGENVYVAWLDTRDGDAAIYFDRSRDGGDSWLAADVRLDPGIAPDPGASSDVDFCVDGQRLVAVWQDLRNGLGDIYANVSDDGGLVWQGPTRVDRGDDAGLTASSRPVVWCAGDQVCAVWADQRADAVNGWDHMFRNVSTDGGRTWSPTSIRIDSGLGAYNAGFATIRGTGPRFFAAWTDNRTGPQSDDYGMYFSHSLDGGVTWAVDLPLDHMNPNASTSGSPQLCVDGARIYACWIDSRDDPNGYGVYSSRRLP